MFPNELSWETQIFAMHNEAETRGDSVMEASRSLTPVDDEVLPQSPEESLCVVVNAPKKSKGPSTSEWDRMRPIVAHLYVEKVLKLKEILSIMAENHNFVATEQMYKKRFMKWGIQKNYRQEQKDALLCRRQQAVLTGQPLSPELINLRPVQEHKIQRYMRQRHQSLGFRQQGAQSLPSRLAPVMRLSEDFQKQPRLTKSTAGSDWTRSWGNYHRPASSPTGIPVMLLCHSSESYNVEECLYSANEYYEIRFQQNASNIIKNCDDLSKFFSSVINGARLLDSQPSRAFSMLRKAGPEIYAAIESQPVDLVLVVYMAMNSEVWKSYPVVKNQLLHLILSMANEVLSRSHPLARTLTCLLKDGANRNTMPTFCQLYLDFVSKWVDVEDSDVYMLQIYVVESLTVCGEPEAAKALCERILKLAKSAYPHNHSITLQILTMLGWILCLQKHDTEAESVWLEVLRLKEAKLGRPNVDNASIVSCNKLGYLYEYQNDHAQCEHYQRLAFAVALRKWGPDHPFTLCYLDDVESVLVKQGKVHEVAQLHIDYGYILEYWDNLEAPDASKM